jgi:hypothetical protein
MKKFCLYTLICAIVTHVHVIKSAFIEAASAEAAEFPTVALEGSFSRETRPSRETPASSAPIQSRAATITPSSTQGQQPIPTQSSTHSQASSLNPSTAPSQPSTQGQDISVVEQSLLEPTSTQVCPPFPCQGTPTCTSCPPGQTCACAAHSGKWVCCDSATICGAICQIESQENYDLVQGLHFLIDVQPAKCGYQWDEPTVDNPAVLHQFKVLASKLGSKIPLTPGATARYGFPSISTGIATITQNQRDTTNNCIVFTKKNQINVIPPTSQ